MKEVFIFCVPVLLAFATMKSFGQNPVHSFSFDNDTDSTKTRETISGTVFDIENHFSRPERIDGIEGKALRFDGFSTWAFANLAINGISDKIAFECWYATEAFNEQTIGLISQLSSQAGFALKVGSFGAVRLEIFASNAKTTLVTERQLNRYKWHHIVAQVDLGVDQMKIYVDGELWGSRSLNNSASTFNFVSNIPFFIGRPNTQVTHNGFNVTTANGAIDNVNIFADTLSQAEILSRYQAGNGVIPDLTVNPDTRHPNDHLRPRYHPMPNTLWANEGYGLTYYKGKYHYFFQKNPNHSDLYFMHWGHISSPDLVNWKEEKMALWPEEGFSRVGVWSGTTVFDTSGLPVISYTGVNGSFAGIGMAFPQDDSLIEWERSMNDPVIPGAPSNIPNMDFRDPFIWWNGDKYYMVVGGGLANNGGGILFTYTSTDLVNWVDAPDIYTNPNRFESGVFWEMPVFLEMKPGIWVLIVTPVFRGGGSARTLFWTGTWDGTVFTPFDEEPKNFESLSRNLLSPAFGKDSAGLDTYIGIIPETRNVQDQIDAAWRQTFSLPRVARLLDDSLIGHYPHPNLCRLRKNNISISNREFLPNTSANLPEVSGNQTEIEAWFVPGPDTDFSLRVFSNASGTEYTDIDFNTKINRLGLDLRNSSPFNTIEENRFATYFFQDTIYVRVFLDHSTIEVFVDNIAVLSSRVYPGEGSVFTDLVVNDGNVLAVEINSWDLETKEDVSGNEVCPPTSLPGSFPTDIGSYILPKSELSAFPTEVENVLSITQKGSQSLNLDARIIDLQGQIVMSETIILKDTFEWKLGSLPSGTYLLMLSDSRNIYSKKILKR
ncbi:MAG: GH32 C-terminal domain-containing protein [Bacteroidia bacterium]|nr:GH32 C-terminal domain-containing protein [Bacteroidia bacterium]